MPLTKLQFRPGIVRDLTSYSNEVGGVMATRFVFALAIQKKWAGGLSILVPRSLELVVLFITGLPWTAPTSLVLAHI